MAAHRRSEFWLHTTPVLAIFIALPTLWLWTTGDLRTPSMFALLLLVAASWSGALMVNVHQWSESELMAVPTAFALEASQRVLAGPATTLILALVVGIGPRILAAALVLHALNCLAARRTAAALNRALAPARAQPLQAGELDGLYAAWTPFCIIVLRRVEF